MGSMLRTAMVLGLCWACVFGAAAAVPETPRFRIIGPAQGLPSTDIKALARDRAGYLWIATADGLARYDGIGMRVWRHDPANPQSLAGNNVQALHIDRRDRVWIAVEGGGIGMLDATRALQAAGPPVIVTPPKAVTVAAGAAVTFTIDAIGVVSYQWTRAGVAIAGATSASYTTPALAAADNNVGYTVVMTNSFGSTTSPAAIVTVSGGSNSPSGGGALPLWQLLLMSGLLLAGRARVGSRKQ